MKAILIDVDKEEITEIDIVDKLENMYKVLKCETIEAIYYQNHAIYVDEEGRYRTSESGLLKAFTIEGFHTDIIGNGLIFKISSAGENLPSKLTVEDMKKVVKFLKWDTKKLKYIKPTIISF